jgi:hypothetical protein
MGSNASKLMATGMATAMLAAVPAVATAKLDYSRNSVSGQYQASPAIHGARLLDYSKNSVSGEYNPVTPSPRPSQVSVPVVKSEPGFSWGAAGAGAGAMLLAAFGLVGARLRHRRGSIPASPMVG